MPAAGAFFLQICVGKAEMSIIISHSFWGKYIQSTSPFKVVFQGFSRHFQIQGRFKAFQGFKVVVATLKLRPSWIRFDLNVWKFDFPWKVFSHFLVRGFMEYLGSDVACVCFLWVVFIFLHWMGRKGWKIYTRCPRKRKTQF